MRHFAASDPDLSPPHKPADNDDDFPPSVPMPQRVPMPLPMPLPGHQQDSLRPSARSWIDRLM